MNKLLYTIVVFLNISFAIEGQKTQSKISKSELSGKWLAFSVGLGNYNMRHLSTSGERFRLENHKGLAKKENLENQLYPSRYLGSGYINPRAAFEFRFNYGEVLQGFSFAIDTTFFNKTHRDNPFYLIANNVDEDLVVLPMINEKNAITPSYYFKRKFGTQINWNFGIDLKSIGASSSCVWVGLGVDYAYWSFSAIYQNMLGLPFAGADHGVDDANEDLNKFYNTLTTIDEKQKINGGEFLFSLGISAGIDVMLSPGYSLFVMGQWLKSVNEIKNSWKISNSDLNTSYIISEDKYSPNTLMVTCGIKINL